MLTCQKHKFSLPENVSYLNCAYFSPLLNHVEKIGHDAISKKRMPYEINIDDFFSPVEKLKKVFAKLIEVKKSERIALMPGVAYGIANVAKNIHFQSNENIIVAAEQFPSNIYSWLEIAKKSGAELKTIHPDTDNPNRGKSWNQNILDAINDSTRLVALAKVHWADGTLFDLKAIRQKCDAHDALLVIDGSQSVGALPFSVEDIRPDALICAGYKWLLGPYSLGLAYFGEKFDHGSPIEEGWINRLGSENFQNLVNYQDEYKPKAFRYNMSESSNFILTPMLSAAIEQILKWKPTNIQSYCKNISEGVIKKLIEEGCEIENEAYRASHLFGIRLGDNFNQEKIKKSLAENKVYVSFRGNAIRVAPHVYNTERDFEKLLYCIKNH